MKYFIKKLGFFCFAVGLFFTINSTINLFFIKNNAPLLKGADILIVGDSHTERSLNPDLFASAENISQPAEPYVLTYWKLKSIFKTYKPDTLVLGFSHHNISSFNDRKFSDKTWAMEMFRRSYSIEHFEDIDHTIKVDYDMYYSTLFHQIGFYPKAHHANYIGKYVNSNRSNISDWNDAVNRHFYESEGKSYMPSLTMINYLDSIVNLTINNKVTLIMVSNPVVNNYRERIPDEIVTVYNELKNKYRKNSIIIDKSNVSYPDSLFLNADHLNSKGAKRFTTSLIAELKKI
ncbi:hypothetical protein [Fulvivirga ligni]|uniref:hypothetical protein n=1 Tax=Fulvivirga ligni TaxID=2904246 RepID=UPI001F28416B|nr:hypothetical protein [Fulvivirga ligni]UII23882.1 hypothetical protein LVD16_11690 [Fulvivirga ligni]